MREIDELRARAMASMLMVANPNSAVKGHEGCQTREEGELSSSEGEALPVGQSVLGASSHAVEPNPVDRRNGVSQTNTGKSLLASSTTISGGMLHRPGTQNHSKRFQKNQLPRKPGTQRPLVCFVPAEADDNLVIRFSDDSGSESEGGKKSRLEKAPERKDGCSSEQDGCRWSDVFPQPKSTTLSKTAGPSEPRRESMKVDSGWESISAMPQVNKSNSRTFGPSAGDRETHIQKHESLTKNIPSRKREFNRASDSTSCKLEILRQQIAIRESELKRKTVSQIKNQFPHLDDDSRTIKPAPASTFMPASDGSDNKRQKLGELLHSKSDADCQEQLAVNESSLELEKQKTEDKQLENENGEVPTPIANSIPGLHVIDLSSKSLHFTRKQGKDNHLGSGVLEGCIQPSASLNENSKFSQMPSSVAAHSCSQCCFSHKSIAGVEKLPASFQSIDSSHEFQNKSICHHDALTAGEHSEVAFGDRTCELTNPGAIHESVQKESLLNYLDHVLFLGHKSNVDVQALLKIEELQDKELEDARELRRKCELEERSILQSYRNAQRALMDANDRCNYLYRQREFFSARIRAFLMEDSSSSWSSRWNEHREICFNPCMNVSKTDANQVPRLSCQMQVDLEALNHVGSGVNMQHSAQGPSDTQLRHLAMRRFDSSNPGSEPDACTAETLPQRDANNPPGSTHEGETSPTHLSNAESSLEAVTKQEKLKKKVKGVSEETARKSCAENLQDSALLEASLRSELFARLGLRTKVGHSNLTPVLTSGHVSDGTVENRKSNMNALNGSNSSDWRLETVNQRRVTDLIDSEGREEIPGKSQIDRLGSDCQSHGSTDLEESSSLRESYRLLSLSNFCLPSSDVKIAFRHLKNIFSYRTNTYNTSKNRIAREEPVSIQNLLKPVVRHKERLDGAAGSPPVNPFWPYCMYELRGKCNDDECPWQHASYCKQRSVEQAKVSTKSDGEVAQKNLADAVGTVDVQKSKVPASTYLIGSHLIKPDPYSTRCVLTRTVWQYWQAGFCTLLGVPFSMHKVLIPDILHLCVRKVHVEDGQRFERPSFYHHFPDGPMKQLMGASGDSEQFLELALDTLNRSLNSQEGMKKALALLSRSLEANPNSVVTWVVYLHIFSSTENAVGKDDMFRLALQHNEDAYELWLMYVNSQMKLSSRLEAYDAALNAFLNKAQSPNNESQTTSSCLLDLVLRMLDFLCMSGNVDRAITQATELLSARKSNNSCQTKLSDILACLEMPDKCALWVCLTYLVMYKKLPETVVERFEFEQELPFGIEWPSIEVTAVEKDQALSLMKKAVDTTSLGINGSLLQIKSVGETVLQSAHLLAVCHVKCVAALEGWECSKNLLTKYMKLYPTCIELSLVWARVQKDMLSEDTWFGGFEEVLDNWPRGLPGIQCIWNQYAEFVLDCGKINLVEKLMIRWFKCAWEVQNEGQAQLLDGDDSSDQLLETCSSRKSVGSSCSVLRDKTFGLLNYSLYCVLQNNIREARLSLNKALKLATVKDFVYFARAHATFHVFDGFDLFKDASAFFSKYLMDVRACLRPEPLSRRFLRSIKRPRIRFLVDNFWTPVSLNTFLINSILEACHGPSLLPDNFGQVKDLVSFVESLMFIGAADCKLVLSVCKVILRLNLVGAASTAVNFWGSSLLVDSIFQAFPVASEQAWVEAAAILRRLEAEGISERFYKLAVCVYPFSLQLWHSYYDLCRNSDSGISIVNAARERGITLS